MKRIILDTNVVISGIFFSGPPYEILKAWKNGKFELITSHEILNEYKRVSEELSEKFKEIDQRKMIDLISLESKVYVSIALPEQVTDDPDDDKFIACALGSKTKLIVSGDKHLLDVNGYKGIRILKPKDFVGEFLKNKKGNRNT
jgi:putative PIN family toxin of toxin-antitoxin system